MTAKTIVLIAIYLIWVITNTWAKVDSSPYTEAIMDHIYWFFLSALVPTIVCGFAYILLF